MNRYFREPTEADDYILDKVADVIVQRDAIITLLQQAQDLAKKEDTVAKDWFADKVSVQVEDIVADLMVMTESEAADHVDVSDYDPNDGLADWLYEKARDEAMLRD